MKRPLFEIFTIRTLRVITLCWGGLMMRYRGISGIAAIGFVFLIFTPFVRAQISTTIGSVVKGFSIPQHGEDGELTSKITGTEANTVSPNRAVIKDLLMEFYTKGEVTMKVTSPKCDYWFLQNRLNTRDGVKIERGGMTITAQSFQWEEKSKKGLLQKNVLVTLNNFNLSNPIIPPVNSPSTVSTSSSISTSSTLPAISTLSNPAESSSIIVPVESGLPAAKQAVEQVEKKIEGKIEDKSEDKLPSISEKEGETDILELSAPDGKKRSLDLSVPSLPSTPPVKSSELPTVTPSETPPSTPQEIPNP